MRPAVCICMSCHFFLWLYLLRFTRWLDFAVKMLTWEPLIRVFFYPNSFSRTWTPIMDRAFCSKDICPRRIKMMMMMMMMISPWQESILMRINALKKLLYCCVQSAYTFSFISVPQSIAITKFYVRVVMCVYACWLS